MSNLPKGVVIKVDPTFLNELKDCMKVRVSKGLADPFKNRTSEISFREATRLATRTNSWKPLLEELRTKPKKKE